MKWFVLAACGIVALTLGLVQGGFDLLGLIVGAVLGTIGVYVYEKKFETAADSARQRLNLA